MPFSFDDLLDMNGSARDKFISRLFGIFNELIVPAWRDWPGSPYTVVTDGQGIPRRPILREQPAVRGHVLDFTFQERGGTRNYVVEMKCWLAFDDYEYLRLSDPGQLRGVAAQVEAFQAFLAFAEDPLQYQVFWAHHELVECSGAILIWGSVDPQARPIIQEHFNLADILSLEEIINHLLDSQDEHYCELIGSRHEWARALFDGLAGAQQG